MLTIHDTTNTNLHFVKDLDVFTLKILTQSSGKDQNGDFKHMDVIF